jgi:hypothetical protein
VGRPLRREDGCVVYNWCWPSPAHSLSGPILAGLTTIFYSLRFETPPNQEGQVPVFISPRTGPSSYISSHQVVDLNLKTQFVPHRNHIRSPLQSPTG